MTMQISEIRSPRFVDADGILIDVEIKHPMYGWIPYTINPADVDQTINNDDLMSLINEAGGPSAYVGPTDEELYAMAANSVRRQRDSLLRSEVDPIITNPLRWAELSADQQQAYVDYRTALLNVPQQAGFPHDVAWPTKPE
jgi:hypothetical protein